MLLVRRMTPAVFSCLLWILQQGCVWGDQMKCYSCMTGAIHPFPGQFVTDQCGTPFSATDTASDSLLYRYCTKVEYFDTIVRMGTPVCTPSTTGDVKVYCCDTDKCNSAPTRAARSLTTLLLASVVSLAVLYQ